MLICVRGGSNVQNTNNIQSEVVIVGAQHDRAREDTFSAASTRPQLLSTSRAHLVSLHLSLSLSKYHWEATSTACLCSWLNSSGCPLSTTSGYVTRISPIIRHSERSLHCRSSYATYAARRSGMIVGFPGLVRRVVLMLYIHRHRARGPSSRLDTSLLLHASSARDLPP